MGPLGGGANGQGVLSFPGGDHAGSFRGQRIGDIFIGVGSLHNKIGLPASFFHIADHDLLEGVRSKRRDSLR